MDKITLLGNSQAKSDFSGPDPSIFESFPVPSADVSSVRFSVSDFTSLCPKTQQPDFGEVVIEYIPRHVCLETKSLKLYLQGYRMHLAFNEQCIATIGEHLWDFLNPIGLIVSGSFVSRGGISVSPVYAKGAIG